MKKTKNVIVESRYMGQFDWPYRGKWFRWRAYYDEKAANVAIELFRKKFSSYEFRIKEKEVEQ